MIVLAVGFFLFFLSIASKSTDPKALMETVDGVRSRHRPRRGDDRHRTHRQSGSNPALGTFGAATMFHAETGPERSLQVNIRRAGAGEARALSMLALESKQHWDIRRWT